MKFSWIDYCQASLIVAHRGSSAITPENTIAAFKQAITDGADAIELDIHLTKDDEVVVIHDSRLNRTTNGKGLVSDYDIAELKSLDAGSRYHQKFADEKIPTLADVFSVIRNKIGINIEIKTEPARKQNLLIVDRCIELVESFRLIKNVLISSFHHPFIERVKEVDQRIATGFLYSPFRRKLKSPVKFTKSIGAEYLITGRSVISRRLIDDAHNDGLLVGEYTVNTERGFKRALRFGIDALITNNPRKIRDLLPNKK